MEIGAESSTSTQRIAEFKVVEISARCCSATSRVSYFMVVRCKEGDRWVLWLVM
jgi:hypothetical protein